MSLGADIAAVLPLLRVEAESRMTETLAFARETTTTPTGGLPAVTSTVLHAAVPGRVKFTTTVVTGRESGGQEVIVQQNLISVPVAAAPDARDGDVITVTVSTVDPLLVGRKFRIVGAPQAGQVTARRFVTVEAS